MRQRFHGDDKPLRLRRWPRPTWGGANRWLILAALVVAFFTAGRAVFATSEAQSPTTARVPTLTPMQVTADRTVRTFFADYDRRDISGIFGLLAHHFTYLDCDYRRHVPVSFDSKPALQRWLLARFRDHDYFGPLGPLIADTGPGKAGVVGPVIRFSDSLVPLASKGLLPLTDNAGFKEVVIASGQMQLAGVYSYCSTGQRLPAAQPKKETGLAKAFLTAYNHHDVAGVIRLLSPSVIYGDCGSADGGSITGVSQVRACLRSRFAEGDTFARPKIILNGYLAQSGPPYTIMIQVLRTNSQLLAEGEAPQVTTLGLDTNVSVTRIRQVQEIAPPTQ